MAGYKKNLVKKQRYRISDLTDDAIDNIKGTILINYKYTPDVIDKLELQSDNYKGLFWIYNRIIEDIAESNKSIK